MLSDRELDQAEEAIDEAREAAHAERDSRPFGGPGVEPVNDEDDEGFSPT
jgi:hypothetical protein